MDRWYIDALTGIDKFPKFIYNGNRFGEPPSSWRFADTTPDTDRYVLMFKLLDRNSKVVEGAYIREEKQWVEKSFNADINNPIIPKNIVIGWCEIPK